MRITSSMLFLAAMAVLTTNGAADTTRMVVAEHITNAGCDSCLLANEALDELQADHVARLAVIRYHGWWPDPGDPFYLANTEENEEGHKHPHADRGSITKTEYPKTHHGKGSRGYQSSIGFVSKPAKAEATGNTH